MWYQAVDSGRELWKVKNWDKYSWLTHGFTSRHWGNLALHVEDIADVITERERLSQHLGISLDSWVVGNQIHKANIQRVKPSDKGRGAVDHASAFCDTDGMITEYPGLFLVTFYADCVPLFFVEPKSRIIGIAHAGWRGTAAQIGPAMVNYFRLAYQQADLNHLEVAIGPSIGSCCYQISEQVAENFSQQSLSCSSDGIYLDLCLANKLQLIASGVNANNIFLANQCTYCNNSFFSFRREGKNAGRMAAFIYRS